jgi:hypothetical protein
MYQQYPNDLIVATSLGSVKVSITDGQHAYIESNEVLIISGKPIRVTLHMVLKNGAWTDKNDSGRSMICAKKPYEMGKNDDATPTQIAKAIAVVVPTVGNFIDANPHLLKEAQAAHVANRIETIQGYIAERLALNAANEKEIAELKATL